MRGDDGRAPGEAAGSETALIYVISRHGKPPSQLGVFLREVDLRPVEVTVPITPVWAAASWTIATPKSTTPQLSPGQQLQCGGAGRALPSPDLPRLQHTMEVLGPSQCEQCAQLGVMAGEAPVPLAAAQVLQKILGCPLWPVKPSPTPTTEEPSRWASAAPGSPLAQGSGFCGGSRLWVWGLAVLLP